MSVHGFVCDVERRLMAGTLTEQKAKTLLTEGLRTELRRIIAVQTAACTLDEEAIDERLAQLQGENAQLRRDARRNDFQAVEALVTDASEAIGCEAPSAIDDDLGRRILTLKRATNAVEAAVFEGDSIEDAAADVLHDHAQ
jgi:hypothetical protein